MEQIIRQIKQCGIIPVVILEREEDALPLARALWEGGLPCAEITFRTGSAKEAIRRMKEAYPQMLLGAGTVLEVEQVRQAMEVGAQFIVSPGFQPKVVSYCLENKIPIIPGCVTPTEITQALEYHLKVIKFFPAEAAGGLSMIKALAAPYPQIHFLPTGGIDLKKAEDYLAEEKVWACGGSWMVNPVLIEQGNYKEITRLTKEAVRVVEKCRGSNAGCLSGKKEGELRSSSGMDEQKGKI